MQTAQLLTELGSLSSAIEDVYLGLDGKFQRLFSELESGLSTPNSVISDLGHSPQRSGQTSSIDRLIGESDEIVANATRYLNQMNRRDGELLDSVSASIAALGGLKTLIETIKEDSVDIELISLNAMTMAIKAGQAGKAFSYITDELKKLATRTIDYADELTSKGQLVIDLFTEFRKALEELQQLHRHTSDGLGSRLGGGMAEISGMFEKIADRLSGAVGKARELSHPLSRIREELQTREIVRQSIDHVLASLTQLDEKVGTALDVAGATALLAGLSRTMLGEVRDRVAGGRDVFESSYGVLRQSLADIETEREDFLRAMTTSADGQDSGWLARLEESILTVTEILDDVDRCIGADRTIRDFGPRLEDGLSAVEESFAKFYQIIDQFYSIEVVSRIEVAKQSVLKQRETILVEMAELTTKIERDVATVVGEIRSSFVLTKETLDRYEETALDDQAEAARVVSSTRQNHSGLTAIKDNMHNLPSRFTLYTQRFLDLVDESENETARFREFALDLEGIVERLGEIEADAEVRKTEQLALTGAAEWRLSDQKVERLVAKFAILGPSNSPATIKKSLG